MSNQTLNLDGQLIESNLLESDLSSDLTPNRETNTIDDRLSPELETSELDIKSTESISKESTKDANLFDDSEIATSSLYSTSDRPPTNKSATLLATTDVSAQTAEEAPPSNLITVGNPQGTEFTFNFADGTSQKVIDATLEAAEVWSSVLKDDVNIKIDFEFGDIGQNIGDLEPIGGTISNSIELPYSLVKEALAADVTSLDDRTAIANIPQDSVDLLTNNTSENNGSDTPYLDNNNSQNNSHIRINTANAKALGIGLEELAVIQGITVEEVATQLETDANLADAEIVISNKQNWDFDRSNGIDSDSADFVGTMVHEIGHALGFSTGTAELDFIATNTLGEIINASGSEEAKQLIIDLGLDGLANSVKIDQFISENEYTLKTLDLFRFSPESLEQDAVDFTTGNIENKYFSIDGGKTVIAPLSTGVYTGDGKQLQHWKDDLGIGLLDPTIEAGVNNLSDNDLQAFDVIGWDVA